MSKFEPQEFINVLNKKVNGRIPRCPYCGGNKFTSTDSMATILISKDKTNINLGPLVPAGMIVCESCGHIEFFALGSLGLLNNGDEKENGTHE